MRFRLLIITYVITCKILSQSSDFSTNQFTITGKVKSEKTYTVKELQSFPSIELQDINTSCNPRAVEKTKSIKVVLLKTLLDSVKYEYEKSKNLGYYYFLFVSSDGYKIVFSFNEIYNTEIGNNLYIVTEMENIKLDQMDSRIMLLTTKDIKGGSRNVKGLSKIIVCAAD